MKNNGVMPIYFGDRINETLCIRKSEKGSLFNTYNLLHWSKLCSFSTDGPSYDWRTLWSCPQD